MRDAPDQTTTLDAETFFADMISALAGTMEDAMGLEDACGFVARVGNEMGRQIGAGYRDANGTLPTDPAALGAILADLKGRIGGDFSVVSADADRIVLRGCMCPFGCRVSGRPSLCMMTTNVFGRIAADATGFASVRIDESIALGHDACRVTVTLSPEARSDGHEFYS